MFIVHRRGTSFARIEQRYGSDTTVIDVTSRGNEPWIRFSPFYPHTNIPVPFSPGWFSASVEGIWQGLKVFELADVDSMKFKITNMKNIKRSTRKYGRVLGHREGVEGKKLLRYLEARWTIYLPTYKWVLDHCLGEQLAELRRIGEVQTVVLLDYETNCDIDNPTHPLSHAGLIKRYIEERWNE